MQAFTDLLYFEPKIQVSDWPRVIEALKVVYPNIRWRSGGKLDIFIEVPCNGLIITSANSMYPGTPLLTWGVWNNMEDFVEHALGVNWKYGEVKDGWEKLGFKQEFDFDSLTESESIRRIIKESIDEFDWVDYNPSLYDLISNLFKHEHPEYWLERFSDETGSVVPMEFLDNSGEDYNISFTDQDNYYFSLNESEFTIENIRKQLQADIIDLKQSKRISIMNDYINLAKALEPIIGPLNYHDSLTESIDEFDWVDYSPSLYDLISSLFKHQHHEYWLEKDFDYENITIADKTGNYIILDESEFTIENIRETLYDNIINLEKDHGRKAFGVRDEYIQLAKALEPIIGSINID